MELVAMREKKPQKMPAMTTVRVVKLDETIQNDSMKLMKAKRL
jgi:hypothetical protein